MVSQGYLQELAERIIEDLRSLDTIFRDRPHEQIEMRRLIKLVEKEWFVRVWVEETRRGRRVLFALTEKGTQKMLSKAAAMWEFTGVKTTETAGVDSSHGIKTPIRCGM